MAKEEKAVCSQCGKEFSNTNPMYLARTLKAHMTKMHGGPRHAAKDGPLNHKKPGHYEIGLAERAELLEDLLRRALIALGIRV